MALRTIRLLGDEILRRKSLPVSKVDIKIKLLLRDLAETMYEADGAGLAAPQIGISKRIVVIDVGDGLINLINPVIIESEGIREVVEGCLSVPGKLGKLERPVRVKVKALDENGKPFTLNANDQLAKALCHEIDHLDGVLYIDKVTEMVDPETYEEEEEEEQSKP